MNIHYSAVWPLFYVPLQCKVHVPRACERDLGCQKLGQSTDTCIGSQWQYFENMLAQHIIFFAQYDSSKKQMRFQTFELFCPSEK